MKKEFKLFWLSSNYIAFSSQHPSEDNNLWEGNWRLTALKNISEHYHISSQPSSKKPIKS